MSDTNEPVRFDLTVPQDAFDAGWRIMYASYDFFSRKADWSVKLWSVKTGQVTRVYYNADPNEALRQAGHDALHIEPPAARSSAAPASTSPITLEDLGL